VFLPGVVAADELFVDLDRLLLFTVEPLLTSSLGLAQ
jgi:hypothetical protein